MIAQVVEPSWCSPNEIAAGNLVRLPGRNSRRQSCPGTRTKQPPAILSGSRSPGTPLRFSGLGDRYPRARTSCIPTRPVALSCRSCGARSRAHASEHGPRRAAGRRAARRRSPGLGDRSPVTDRHSRPRPQITASHPRSHPSLGSPSSRSDPPSSTRSSRTLRTLGSPARSILKSLEEES